ncbi:hypothetical protein EVAR_100562_1 [Eumeta japonica]|uniref:Uncharacterized protein n=1 Tax=Eumeta variegata TaxID=151549 RepID=A0A4C1YFI8_EUMVA|nr:hypothetical protein EVAR_100562_1 [Eumeta japonica]
MYERYDCMEDRRRTRFVHNKIGHPCQRLVLKVERSNSRASLSISAGPFTNLRTFIRPGSAAPVLYSARSSIAERALLCRIKIFDMDKPLYSTK